MTEPDKPLHERITEFANTSEDFSPLPHPAALWMTQAHALLREAAAELFRMRTALEEVRDRRGTVLTTNTETEAIPQAAYSRGAIRAYSDCATLAERALTAGSGNDL